MSVGGQGGRASPAKYDQRCLVFRFTGGGETVVRFVNRATASGFLKRIVGESPGSVAIDWDVTADESFHLIYLSKVTEIVLPPLDKSGA